MSDTWSTDHKTTAKLDLAAIGAMTSLLALVFLILFVRDVLSAIEIMPYILLSGAVCFGAYVYRRLREAGRRLASGDRVRMEIALRESEERHRHFAADVAHELRTPLAVLRSRLDNLNDSGEVQFLCQDVDNMSRLVTQLLAATRIETLNPEDALNDVDLRDICRNVATHLAPLAIKDQRSIELTGGQEPVLVRGHAASLEQAVRNLVENAIRYSARGTVITMNVKETDNATLKVIDRGRGIARELREKIFQRFKRSDRRSGGAGLGLSIVKRTLENHRAKIKIEDTPGGGATFIIQFPVN